MIHFSVKVKTTIQCGRLFSNFAQSTTQQIMEEIFLRFSHLSETIFDSLNSESLAKSKEVCRSWYQYLDKQKFLHSRAEKVKEIIETVEMFQQISRLQISKKWKNPFDMKTKKIIIDDARNCQFDLVHAKIMKNIDAMKNTTEKAFCRDLYNVKNQKLSRNHNSK